MFLKSSPVNGAQKNLPVAAPRDFSRLPARKTFAKLLFPYAAPYVVYVGIESLLSGVIDPELTQVLKLIAVSAVLGLFRHDYRFGRVSARQGLAALVATPAALLAWCVPLVLWEGFHSGLQWDNVPFSLDSAQFLLRAVNSVFLVALFEELFIRVYLMEWFYHAGHHSRQRQTGLAHAVTAVLEQRPQLLAVLPFSFSSLFLTTLVFTMGHSPREYVSAVLYFSVTNMVYQKTGSLWVCILIHGLTNLSIALLVKFCGMHFLWP